MDDSTLASLRAAYALSVDNLTLRLLLAKGLVENGAPEEARQLIAAIPKTATPGDADRREAARLALACDDGALALGFLDDETAGGFVLRARAHLLLGQHDTGWNFYQKAVALDPAQEDVALAQALKVKPVPKDDEGDDNIVHLKLVKNGAQAVREGDAPEGAKDILPVAETTATFADVGGLQAVKKIIHRRIILPFQKPTIFKTFKRQAGGGVLMYGPPGCGKTLLARATAGECGAKFYNVAISDILDMWLGNSEKNLHAIFAQARRTAPAILFFDEIEALAGKRQDATAGSKAISQFLSEMDGFAKDNEGVLVMGATNVPWSVDAAFRRPGRFDRVLFVPPPDKEARLSILKIHLAGRPAAGNIDLPAIAAKTGGFSGADLKNLVETACDIAIDESLSKGAEVPVGPGHLKEALEEVRPTTLEWLSTARNYARYSNEGGRYDDVLKFLDEHGR